MQASYFVFCFVAKIGFIPKYNNTKRKHLSIQGVRAWANQGNKFGEDQLIFFCSGCTRPERANLFLRLSSIPSSDVFSRRPAREKER